MFCELSVYIKDRNMFYIFLEVFWRGDEYEGIYVQHFIYIDILKIFYFRGFFFITWNGLIKFINLKFSKF